MSAAQDQFRMTCNLVLNRGITCPARRQTGWVGGGGCLFFLAALFRGVKYVLFFSRVPDRCIPMHSRAAHLPGHDQHFHGSAPAHHTPARPHAAVCQRAGPERLRDHWRQHAESHRPGGGGDTARPQSYGGEICLPGGEQEICGWCFISQTLYPCLGFSLGKFGSLCLRKSRSLFHWGNSGSFTWRKFESFPAEIGLFSLGKFWALSLGKFRSLSLGKASWHRAALPGPLIYSEHERDGVVTYTWAKVLWASLLMSAN